MSASDETESPAIADIPVGDIPVGDPEELTKNPAALKDAHEQMAALDVLVCGQCHTAFHFLEEFTEHKGGSACTGKSPVKDSAESKAQVWAFLLWKCSSARDGPNVSNDNSWKLYQQWCRMPEAQRTAWIAAGTNVQVLSKYAHAKVTELQTDDQQVPMQSSDKKRGRPKKPIMKTEDSETQPSEESDVGIPLKKTQPTKKPMPPQQSKTKVPFDDSVRTAQERVPPEERIARRTERVDGQTVMESGEYVVEKILAKRFNPNTKQYEFLLKWEGYTHDQNTWEPVENMETCKHLLEAFEKQLARQKELKAMRAQMAAQGGQNPVKLKQYNTPTQQVLKQIVKKNDSPALTPAGRLQRSSKARALDQVKAWCGGGDEEPASKRIKKEEVSEDDDFSESEPEETPMRFTRVDKRVSNGQSSPKTVADNELVKSLGLGGKGMPNIKGVIKVDPKHVPNLSTGVYIMSKSSGIMKIDSPGKVGPGLNIDQNVIRKQILAAKQKKIESEKAKVSTLVRTPGQQQKKMGLLSQQVTEKTIITPSGQKIIQRTIQRTPAAVPSDKSPVTILNKKLAMQGGDSLLRRNSNRGRGGSSRGGYSITTASGNVIRLRDKNSSTTYDREIAQRKTASPPSVSVTRIASFGEESDLSSETSDGIEDPFPKELGPIPPPSPDRELTLCPESGKRLARAEGEPTPPPTPSPPPTPPPVSTPMLMKVEMSPGGTTGLLVQGDSAQQSLPMLTDEDGTEVKVEASAVKQLLEEGVGVDEGEEVNLLHGGHTPIMIRGEDGVLYQVAGENEDGQTLLVAAEGVEGVEGVEEAVEGEEGEAEGDGGVMYVTREDGQEVLAIDPEQLAQLLPGGGGGTLSGLQQVAVQVEGEAGEDATQVIAQLVQADLPSPGGTRRVVLLLPDGSFTMTELDKDQYEAITEAGKTN